MKHESNHSPGAYLAMVIIWLMLVVVIGLTITVVTISHNLSNERQYHARHAHNATDDK